MLKKQPAERLKLLRESSNPQAQFLWAILRDSFHYAAVHLADIHLEKGMHCVDCHFIQDSHGNTKLYVENLAQPYNDAQAEAN